MSYITQEAMSQLEAFFLIVRFLQQQIAEPLFEAVDGFQSRPCPQISGQALRLILG